MIIFGWGHVTRKQYGPAMVIACPHCNNETWYHLIRLRKWFTLFFVPIIPYVSRHLLICQVCTREIRLSGDKIQKAKLLNELTNDFFGDKISESEYRFEAKKIALLAQEG